MADGSGRMQALAQPTTFQSGLVAEPKLDAVDALSVGQSLRTLARQRYMPTGTADIYNRVGEQLIAAANVAIEESRK